MKKILVTGAAGFIGSHVLEKLLNKGFDAIGIDNFDDFYSIEKKQKHIKSFRHRVADLCLYKDIERVSELFDRKFDCVIHLAAKAGVRNSLRDKNCEYIKHNVIATQHLLNLCRDYNIKKFIFASSSSVYGMNRQLPFKEDLLPMPISPYAASKAAAESLIHSYSVNYEIQSKCLRFFTVYGPRQRPEMAIDNFIRKIINDEEIIVFGDGSIRRDFTYIDDIIRGIFNCVIYDNPNLFEIINLGNGEAPITINELINIIEFTLSKKAKVKYLDSSLGDMPITWSNINKSKLLINYFPEVSIEEGIRTTCDFIKAFP